MKQQTVAKAALQVLLWIVIELAILLAMIFGLSWAAWHDWPILARMSIFLVGFAVFSLPVILIAQRPYRMPGWLKTITAGSETVNATLRENPYANEEWLNGPADLWVNLSVTLESGEESWLFCTLGVARRLSLDEPLAVWLAPSHPDRCALAQEPE